MNFSNLVNGNDGLILVCLCLAVFRIYLEVLGVDLNRLPITARLGAQGQKIHRFGLIMSIGYVLLFAPQFLLR